MANNDRGASICCGLVAQIFGITALVLMLLWLLHYRDGLNLYSHDPNRVFNVHPFLMFFGFMFFLAQALITHGGLGGALTVLIGVPCRVVAICLGGVGIHAAVKSHHMLHFGNHTRSVHSWIGIAAFALFIFESVVWLLACVGRVTCCNECCDDEEPSKAAPSGRIALHIATCAAVTGLMEKASKDIADDHLRRGHRESTIINVLALFIILFTATVDMSVLSGSFARAISSTTRSVA
ncbi:unnamed protein product [Cuscuta campestris]|uniref:Cytochrome b561 domain-containing protein n=1 Tax=Cuscuta campestris TaxID=132261 RepID=A0A484NR02_9ASTE|nr:unnamed protein product [Cuscuta campestris]